ncbi:MAG: hypothetical protein B7Z21_00770 [Verrucomicrobiales bacterium 32-60-5]|nr:MAG: hypothetical protein B7Z21_00770 [Verrucomicrobiales bacterium 32-60-5]
MNKREPSANALVNGLPGALKAVLKIRLTVLDKEEPLALFARIWMVAVFHPERPVKPMLSVPMPLLAAIE